MLKTAHRRGRRGRESTFVWISGQYSPHTEACQARKEVLRVDAESGEERRLTCVLHGGQVLSFFTNMNPTITCLFESVLAS